MARKTNGLRASPRAIAIVIARGRSVAGWGGGQCGAGRSLKLWALLAATSLATTTALAQTALPGPDPAFQGKIARSVDQSTPAWPARLAAPANAPNIVIILLDDIGFADTSTFGGLAQTPELDRIAATGLRYNDFNNAGMCSPTRAALLSGRNHHQMGFGVAERSGGFPGYNFIWRRDTASIAQILRLHGYSTSSFGKWHNTLQSELSPVGPFDYWPTGLGFDYFYGFIDGMNNQWEPSSLYRNTTPVDPPRSPAQGYHLTTDITDEAIGWLRTHDGLAPDKPYFLYYATGAVHEPHQVPAEWIERYRGKFDRGWDVLRREIFARQKRLGVIPADTALTPRPKEIPAWSSLSADEKRLYARQMEVYAAFVAQTDHEVGRLVEAIRAAPNGDNTLIFYIVGDNGSTGEAGVEGYTNRAVKVADQLTSIDELGGARAWNQYSAGWGWMGATPFQWWKGIASHFGATRNPLIVSWPARIRAGGGLRSQFTHVNDVAPTIYDLLGIAYPDSVDGVKQLPLDGASFAATFDRADAPAPKDTQYFEMIGNRAIYHDGWVAAAPYVFLGFEPSPFEFHHDRARWELYHVADDFSEAHDLAGRYPAKLTELQQLFDREAWKNHVYPLGGGLIGGTPTLLGDRTRFTYHVGQPRLQKTAIPNLANRSYRITAELGLAGPSSHGVVLSYGSRLSGMVLYARDGQWIFEKNIEGRREQLVAPIPAQPGKTVVTLDYRLIEKGVAEAELSIDGTPMGKRRFANVEKARYLAADVLGIGEVHGSIGNDDLAAPSRFDGTIDTVGIELLDPPAR